MDAPTCADVGCERANDGHFHADPDQQLAPVPAPMELAERLYNAYGESRSWKTFAGGVMPRWHENKDAGVLAGWRAAAAEAVNALGGQG
jgi:hypothetical protein